MLRAMTRFRPCIDLHEGKVKQIVGGTLRDDGPGPRVNFTASAGAGEFAAKFRDVGVCVILRWIGGGCTPPHVVGM
mgnify:CR=1 FL=1